MSSYRTHTAKAVARLKPCAPKLAPLLDYEGTFTLYEAGIEDNEDWQPMKGVIQKAIQHGAIEKVESTRVERESGSTRVWEYRWNPDARRELQSYLDGLDQMPDCGCRLHVPDGRDAPEGQLRCNHCGQLTDKADLRECLE